MNLGDDMARTVNLAVKEQNRRKILDAALSLFSIKGFFATKITEIAKEAGMSHAAVFTYFASKEEILNTVILEPLEEERERFRACLSYKGTTGEILKHIVREHVTSIMKRKDLIRVIMTVIGQPAYFEHQSAAIYDFSNRFVAEIAQLIEKGQASKEIMDGDAMVTSLAYYSYVNGLIFIEPYPMDQIEEYVNRGCRIIGILEG